MALRLLADAVIGQIPLKNKAKQHSEIIYRASFSYDDMSVFLRLI